MGRSCNLPIAPGARIELNTPVLINGCYVDHLWICCRIIGRSSRTIIFSYPKKDMSTLKECLHCRCERRACWPVEGDIGYSDTVC